MALYSTAALIVCSLVRASLSEGSHQKLNPNLDLSATDKVQTVASTSHPDIKAMISWLLAWFRFHGISWQTEVPRPQMSCPEAFTPSSQALSTSVPLHSTVQEAALNAPASRMAGGVDAMSPAHQVRAATVHSHDQ